MHALQWTIILITIFSVQTNSGIVLQNGELNEIEEVYLKFFVQLENVKKSLEILQSEVNALKQGSFMASGGGSHLTSYEERQKARNFSKPIFDGRIDELPAHCKMDKLPSNCAEATKCTETSGYYKLSVSRYGSNNFLAFCDYRTLGGDWLQILRRVDGSQNFSRNWHDYVNGFGEVDREYWIGLENLYALTNHDGAQEMYIYMVNHSGHNRFARYDHFLIGNEDEGYPLKSLGIYSGNAGNSMEFSLGAKFSTYDEDHDIHKLNCAEVHKGGWWYKNCAKTVPTGYYHSGPYNGQYADGIYWKDWLDYWHSMRVFVIMIRRQRIFLN